MNKLEQSARHVFDAWNHGSPLDMEMAALEEALAEPELNLNCKSVQKRLATSWGYVKAEQAEQEPVAWSQRRKRNLIKHWAFDCDWGDLTEREIDDLELIINAVLNAAPVSAEAIRADQRQKDAAACYLRAKSWKDNAARAAKLCGDAITAMGNDTV